MADKKNPSFDSIQCQIWFQSDPNDEATKTTVEVSNVTRQEYMWLRAWGYQHDGSLHPWLLTCPVGRQKDMHPHAVSLVEDVCRQANNSLKVSLSFLTCSTCTVPNWGVQRVLSRLVKSKVSRIKQCERVW